jgi:hypothetical protein
MLNFIIKGNKLAIQKSESIYYISAIAKTNSHFIPESEFDILFVFGLISGDFENEDVDKIFKWFSNITSQNIFWDDNVNGLISGFLQNLPIIISLYFLASQKDFDLTQENLSDQFRKRLPENMGQDIQSTSYFLHVYNNFIDIEVLNREIFSILKELIQRLGLILFLLGNLKETVSVLVYDLSLDECMDLFVSSNNYFFKKMEKLCFVGSKINKLLTS